ncbi:HNH endonuclease [Streptomyces pini]|uniref:5-methylcytosine-specific restriction enzyme A n=1 Tax=Streptomyces pini TaxID=1520580 RepID=A0A1I4BYB5_9ACTN|nr:HNH endonuclease signature motif containing protein [Streptomyces pini]SFK73513.1 5-methylcytosine-specific restriction enzyme A [Streptomyces pini]
MSGGWKGSRRRHELPPNWKTQIRPYVLERDRYSCRGIDSKPCGRPANQVDHIGDRNDHRPENLQALCADCHAAKTSRQGNTARWAVRERRPAEKHPGLL